MRIGIRKRGIAMVLVLAAMVFAGTARAQETTTTETKSFEILSVDGNVLVIREPTGTRELTVPSDFLFNVDGKSLAVTDLKPGMKGTATVTKTTISRPVYVTEVRNAKVVEALGGTVIVQGPDGFKMYSHGDLEKKGISIFMDGKPVKIDDLREGDMLTASMVTEGPPQVMSKTQVDVTLAKVAEARASGGTVAATRVLKVAAVELAAADSSGGTSAETMGDAPVSDTTATPAAAPPTQVSTFVWVGLIVVVIAALILMRRRSKR